MGRGSHYVLPVPDSITIMLSLNPIVPSFLAVAAIAYAGLAARVARSAPHNPNNMVSFFLFLIAGMLAGAAFSYGTVDPVLYGIGRFLSFFSAGFIALVFYVIYREYTMGSPNWLIVMMLAVIPMVTAGLALTNPMHNAIWAIQETSNGPVFSDITDHYWYTRVYAPFTYGLIAYSALGLIARLPTIAPAHRKTIGLLLLCMLMPYSISIANTFLGMGPPEFPFTAASLAVLWPLFAYASLKLRVYDFSPLAYETLFDHVRDPILVIDSEQSIICANRAAQELLQGSERELIGRKLWEDFPAAQAILEQAKELDLTQTLRMDTNNVYEVSVGPLT